ncbi:MAG: hypothetical protein AB1656_06870 [Candidatus Omnitrophota bacterium]
MNERHLTDEELLELLDESCEALLEPEHLQDCPDCQKRRDELAWVLDCTKSAPAPQCNPNSQAEIFDRAWQASGRGSIRRFSWRWPIIRYAFSFATGAVCGMLLLFFLVREPAAANGVADHMKQAAVPVEIRGTDAVKVYARLENPVFVIQEKSDNPNGAVRTIQGTVDRGAIQVVWNLPPK